MPEISLYDLAALAGAVVLAAVGGEAFLRGVLGIAVWLRVPKLLVATTLAAFATSSPELTVSTIAALAGKPEIGLGDALGSNVVNIALILGIALLFGPISTGPKRADVSARRAAPAPRAKFNFGVLNVRFRQALRHELGRDFSLAILTPLLTLWFASNGEISHFEGAILLTVFSVWMGFVIRAGAAARGTIAPTKELSRHGLTIFYGIIGLAALITAGRLFVVGATGIAGAFGIHPYVIGAIVVAIGTSLPELVTLLLARWRGHDDIGIGTLLGSNLFNGLAIVGTAASIHPIHAPLTEIAITIGFGIIAVVLMIPNQDGLITRMRGLWLLLAYTGFVLATLAAGRGFVA